MLIFMFVFVYLYVQIAIFRYNVLVESDRGIAVGFKY